jgi:glycosyltransferase involved in cell wall biosynthesis
LRVIARLNVGGPAIQAITLTHRLEERGWATTLVRGNEAPREGTMDPLAERLGVRPVLLASLEREINPLRDLQAAFALRQMMRRERPIVLHTHTAKAGTVGRIAAATFRRRRRPLVVHTYHGHVLSGYFSKRKERLFAGIERMLARRSDVLVAVSEEVRQDLLQLGIGSPEQIRVVPLGFDLGPFDPPANVRALRRSEVRKTLAVADDALLVTLVARLVPIKRVDVFLDAAVRVVERHPTVRFCVAGDGELGDALRALPSAIAIEPQAAWPGFVSDMPSLYAASDIVVLCSDNEGTPVSLIEALASGVAVAATRVGGVPSVVSDGLSGLLSPAGDAEALSRSIERLIGDAPLRQSLGEAGKQDVFGRYGLDRLVDDIDRLYREAMGAADRRRFN